MDTSIISGHGDVDKEWVEKMLPSTTMFTVVAPILLMTAIVILSIGIMYRIREQILASIGMLFLGASFLFALLGINKIDETLMTGYGWKYQFVKLLEAGLINPFKGAVSPSYIQLGSWQESTVLFLVAATSLVIGASILTYIGSLMFGLDTAKAIILPIVVFIIGIAGVYYMQSSTKILTIDQNIPYGLKARDFGAGLRTIAILLAFMVLAIGTISLYIETKTRVYVIYSTGYTLSGMGWALFATSWFTSFKKLSIFQVITAGKVTTPVNIFIASAFFIILGAITLLIASIVEIVSSTMPGIEELGGELEEGIPEEVSAEAEAPSE